MAPRAVEAETPCLWAGGRPSDPGGRGEIATGPTDRPAARGWARGRTALELGCV